MVSIEAHIGATYSRVSTSGQKQDGTSLVTQNQAEIELANERGIQIPEEYIFSEQASGADSNRPVLNQVRQLARDGKIRYLIVYHPDRLSRDAVDLMVISDEIAAAGVELIFVHGPSGSSPEDKLLRFIFGYKSEAERRDTMERTMRGKLATARNGKLPNGTGHGLYGYRTNWIPDPVTGRPKVAGREIVENEAEVVREIFDMANSSHSYHKIATVLNDRGVPTKSGSKWHPWTIKNMLKNTSYKGKTYYGKERVTKPRNSTKRIRKKNDPSQWIEVKGFTPPIVSEATFKLAQKRLAEPKSRTGKAITPYLLSGHLVCGHCSTPLVGSTLNRRYRYYRCRGTFPTATSPRYCDASYIRADRLEPVVWNAIRDVLQNPKFVLEQMQLVRGEEEAPITDEIMRLKREVKRCKNQELRLVKLYQFGEVDDEWITAQSGPLKLMREHYEARIEQLNHQLEGLVEMKGTVQQLEAFCERVRQNLDSFGFEEKRMTLETLQIKAIVTKEEANVTGILGVTGVEPDLATTARTSA